MSETGPRLQRAVTEKSAAAKIECECAAPAVRRIFSRYACAKLKFPAEAGTGKKNLVDFCDQNSSGVTLVSRLCAD
jgi:hypothetical protein